MRCQCGSIHFTPVVVLYESKLVGVNCTICGKGYSLDKLEIKEDKK